MRCTWDKGQFTVQRQSVTVTGDDGLYVTLVDNDKGCSLRRATIERSRTPRVVRHRIINWPLSPTEELQFTVKLG